MYFNTNLKEHLVVIGGNVSGLAAASQARRNAPELEITVIESSNYISYGTCGLPYYISGVIDDIKKLFVYSPEFFKKERNISVRTNCKALFIDTLKREIIIQDMISAEKSTIKYDRLVISSGAVSFNPGIDLSKTKNVFFFRNVEDALRLKEFIRINSPKKAAVVGGGSIGLLLTEALLKSGMEVTLIEKKDRILNEFEEEFSLILQKIISLNKVNILTGYELSSTEPDEQGFAKILSVKNKDLIQSIEADLVILCAGIRANTDFLSKTSIELGVSKTIKTNNKMQTSYSNIYAAGDCACVKNIVTGKYDFIPTANNAAKTGRVAGDNITGADSVFPGSVGTKVDQIFGMEIAKTGISYQEALSLNYNPIKIAENYSSHAKVIPGAKIITAVLIADIKTGKILGAQMAGMEGAAKRIDVFASAITSSMTVDDVYMLDLSYSPGTSTVWDPVNKICGRAQLELSKRSF